MIHFIVFVIGYFITIYKYNLSMSYYLNELRCNTVSIYGFIGMLLIYYFSYLSLLYGSITINLSKYILYDNTLLYIFIFVINVSLQIAIFNVLIHSDEVKSLQQSLRHNFFSLVVAPLIILTNLINIGLLNFFPLFQSMKKLFLVYH